VDSGSLFHFLDHCGIGNLWTFVSMSHTINDRFVDILVEMTDADKIVIRFGTDDPTDIKIRINTFVSNVGVGGGLCCLSAPLNNVIVTITPGKAPSSDAGPNSASNPASSLVVIATLSIITAAVIFPGAVLVCMCHMRRLRAPVHDPEKRKSLHFSRSNVVSNNNVFYRHASAVNATTIVFLRLSVSSSVTLMDSVKRLNILSYFFTI